MRGALDVAVAGGAVQASVGPGAGTKGRSDGYYSPRLASPSPQPVTSSCLLPVSCFLLSLRQTLDCVSALKVGSVFLLVPGGNQCARGSDSVL